jgi:predicted DNA-binding transcriptional regulator AlpA
LSGIQNPDLTVEEDSMGTGINYVEVVVLPDGRMDTKNAAKYLGLSTKTLACYRSRGGGPKSISIGRVFYYLADLDAWIQDRAKNGGKP